MFNTLFHEINRDGRLRAHVARLCAVAWRKLMPTKVRPKLQELLLLPKTAAPTYIGMVSAPFPIHLTASTCGHPTTNCSTLTGKFESARLVVYLCVSPDLSSITHNHSQVAYRRCLIRGLSLAVLAAYANV